jgi:hypothetical protein
MVMTSHDGFLLEFELIKTRILGYFKREFPSYYYYYDDDDEIIEDFAITRRRACLGRRRWILRDGRCAVFFIANY